VKWTYIGIGILTWIVWAILFFLVNPILGILAFVLAAILTEALLRAARAEDSARVNSRPLIK
jgi:hypothetical protein